MLNSHFRPLVSVTLPYFGRQDYMHSFDLTNPVMKPGFEDYLKPVVALIRAAGALTGIAHMTVDEKAIEAGQSQRRPKPHVDGCFMPRLSRWGHDNGPPTWNHHCNEIPGRMSVIVASTVAGCRAWTGKVDAKPKNNGDLSHIEDQLGEGVVLTANVGYLLSPDCIHESMVFNERTTRTFLRIALPIRGN